jgi:hypothetical protein
MLVRMQQNRHPYALLAGKQISRTIIESHMEIPPKAKDRTTL